MLSQSSDDIKVPLAGAAVFKDSESSSSAPSTTPSSGRSPTPPLLVGEGHEQGQLVRIPPAPSSSPVNDGTVEQLEEVESQVQQTEPASDDQLLLGVLILGIVAGLFAGFAIGFCTGLFLGSG